MHGTNIKKKKIWIGLFTVFMILESLKMSVYSIKLFLLL